MKNTNKMLAMLTAITIATMLFCGVVLTAQAEDAEVYELLGVVTGYEDMEDCTEYTVTVEDGTLLVFYADHGDYKLGDMVWLDVWSVTQKEVLEVYYVTTLEWDEMFRWLDRIYL